MDIDQQIQVLIDEAPDATTAKAVEVVAPLLKGIASQLQQREYYILQTLEQGWMMTTLSNRQSPDTRKTVIYAYPSLAAAATAGQQDNPQLMALPHPVTHLLFQLLALKQVDSFIFLENRPGQSAQGAEIRRQDLERVLQGQLNQGPTIPPDIA
jgi:hypothetical protein